VLPPREAGVAEGAVAVLGPGEQRENAGHQAVRGERPAGPKNLESGRSCRSGIFERGFLVVIWEQDLV